MHSTTKPITACGLSAIIFFANGCTPPEPQPPAPKAVPTAAPAEPETATSAQPQAAAESENAPDEGPQLVPPTDAPQQPIAQSKFDEDEPRGRTAFYRADAAPAEIPPVVLSKGHEALCRVKVGDAMPEILLPRLDGNDEPTDLAKLSGEKATVVVFWSADRRMAREQLADLRSDVIEPFADRGVAVVGIAVEKSRERAESALQQARADFPNLLDAGGEAFAKVGSQKLPRTYLLDPQGKILWFDIEYSLGTRRELRQALRAVVGEPAPGKPASAGG